MSTELNEIYWNTRYLYMDSGWDVGFLTSQIKN
jgi:hypothetical protein